MLSLNLSVNVGSPGVWVGTSDVVRRFGTNVSSPDAYVNYKSSAKFNFTDKYLTTSLSSGLVKMLGHFLDAVMPPNRRSNPNPKMEIWKTKRQTHTSNLNQSQ